MGPAAIALTAATGNSDFTDQLSAAFGGLQILDDSGNNWTVFAPTNTSIAGATINVQDYIFVGTAQLDAAALGALTTITTNAQNTYAVTNTDGAITVGGHAVTLITVGEGATVYSMEGAL